MSYSSGHYYDPIDLPDFVQSVDTNTSKTIADMLKKTDEWMKDNVSGNIVTFTGIGDGKPVTLSVFYEMDEDDNLIQVGAFDQNTPDKIIMYGSIKEIVVEFAPRFDHLNMIKTVSEFEFVVKLELGSFFRSLYR